MKDHLEHIIFFRDLPPEQAERLARVIASDPRAARVFRLWRDLRDDLARQLEEAVGDRELFALFILQEFGDGSLLTDAERSRVDREAPRLRQVLADHPGLAGAADDIKRACSDFGTTWDEWFGDEIRIGRDDPGTSRPARTRDDRSTSEARPRIDRSVRERGGRTTRWTARAAIGTAVVVFSALLVFVLQRDHGMTSVATAEGETQIVELGGGSTVRLLSGSRVSFTPPEDAAPIGRQVVLEGRGFFEIVPDGHGLVVKTASAQLTVLGTSFGVQTFHEATEVVLAQGRLSLAPLGDPARSVVLESGQMSRVNAQGPPSAPEPVSVHEQLSWTGLFVFSSAPLESILTELQQHYGTALFASPDYLDERVTGRFEQEQELTAILETIAAAVGAQVEELPDGGYRLR